MKVIRRANSAKTVAAANPNVSVEGYMDSKVTVWFGTDSTRTQYTLEMTAREAEMMAGMLIEHAKTIRNRT